MKKKGGFNMAMAWMILAIFFFINLVVLYFHFLFQNQENRPKKIQRILSYFDVPFRVGFPN